MGARPAGEGGMARGAGRGGGGIIPLRPRQVALQPRGGVPECCLQLTALVTSWLVRRLPTSNARVRQVLASDFGASLLAPWAGMKPDTLVETRTGWKAACHTAT